MIEIDKYSGRMVDMAFRVFKKDRTAISPDRETLRVLVEGKEKNHWVGRLYDVPHHAKQLRRGCGIWLRKHDVERSRPLTSKEARELAAGLRALLLTGKPMAGAN